MWQTVARLVRGRMPNFSLSFSETVRVLFYNVTGSGLVLHIVPKKDTNWSLKINNAVWPLCPRLLGLKRTSQGEGNFFLNLARLFLDLSR